MYRVREDRKAKHLIRWNCLVLLVTPHGVPLVAKPHRTDFLGLPGGGDLQSEKAPHDTALREFLEETGYNLRELDQTGEMLKLAHTTRKRSYDPAGTGAQHDYHLFVGKTQTLPRARPTITGEVVYFKPAQEFSTAGYFLPPHRDFLARPEVIQSVARALGR